MYFYASSCLTINDKRIFFVFAISLPYNLWRVLASIYCISILSSMFYFLIRVLSLHRVLSPHPCFIPSCVSVSVPSVSVSVFYPNPLKRLYFSKFLGENAAEPSQRFSRLWCDSDRFMSASQKFLSPYAYGSSRQAE